MKSVGLFLGTTEDSYGKEIIQGTLRGLEGSGLRLVCFTSGTIHSQHGYEAQRNVLYDLVDSRSVDALIIAGSLSHSVSYEELLVFCRRYHPVPVITMSISLEGIPCVVADNAAGFRQIMDHLLKEHGYTRLAFVGGPEGQQEAEIRKRAFLDSLAEAGLKPNPDWLLLGDYTRHSGHQAAAKLLESLAAHPGRERFQAIVCANDSMAMGVQDELEAKGWRFPEDCALTGFDDTTESQIREPPLTTVFQSLADQAAQSARVARALLAGESPPAVSLVMPELKVRRSCGCQRNRNEGMSCEDFQTALDESEQAFRRESQELALISELMERLRGTTESILTSDSFARLLEVLNQSLSHLGYRGFWLSLFEDPTRPGYLARQYLGHLPDKDTEISLKGQLFASKELIPGGIRQILGNAEMIVVEALYSRNFRMGFMMFATDRIGAQITGSLRGQISGALQAVLLLEERRQTERQLIQSEKMAALGSLVAGIAHEINTPLGVAITAWSFLAGRAAEFGQRFERNEVTRSELVNLLDDFRLAGKSIESNLSRAANMVASFKQVSSDQASEQRRSFGVREYLEEVLVSLQFQWKNRPIEVTVDGPAGLEIDSYPGTIAQAINILISNALLHAFAPDRPGHITIGVEEIDDHLAIWVADDGAGIPAEHQEHIFEPFFTTKRGQGGTGLGLHILYNLVTKRLGGSINFVCHPGQGTRFEIQLPRKAPDTPPPAEAAKQSEIPPGVQAPHDLA